MGAEEGEGVEVSFSSSSFFFSSSFVGSFVGLRLLLLPFPPPGFFPPRHHHPSHQSLRPSSLPGFGETKAQGANRGEREVVFFDPEIDYPFLFLFLLLAGRNDHVDPRPLHPSLFFFFPDLISFQRRGGVRRKQAFLGAVFPRLVFPAFMRYLLWGRGLCIYIRKRIGRVGRRLGVCSILFVGFGWAFSSSGEHIWLLFPPRDRRGWDKMESVGGERPPAQSRHKRGVKARKIALCG